MNDNNFKLIRPEEINDNVFRLINNDWMLITAGNIDKYNMMTASWGGMGILWHKKVTFCFIRPQRYTFNFMEKGDYYTLSFFGEDYRVALNICGSISGKNSNKTKVTGFTPDKTENGAVYFKEARLIIECKKLYSDFIKPANFFDDSIENLYPIQDYHKFYIGEITNIMSKF